MNDLINRQAAIEACLRYNGVGWVWSKILDEIEKLPSVDVVRCKDCKWFNDIGCSIRIVDDSDKPTENDYCSFGERKDARRI